MASNKLDREIWLDFKVEPISQNIDFKIQPLEVFLFGMSELFILVDNEGDNLLFGDTEIIVESEV